MNALEFIKEIESYASDPTELDLHPNYGDYDEDYDEWEWEYYPEGHKFRHEIGSDYSRYLDAMVNSIQEEWERDAARYSNNYPNYLEEYPTPLSQFEHAKSFARVFEKMKATAAAVGLALDE